MRDLSATMPVGSKADSAATQAPEAGKEAETTILDRLIAEASVLAGGDHPCNVLGHVWVQTGGRWCGCSGGSCSVPVHECRACGDCDYGDNDAAKEIMLECECVQELN